MKLANELQQLESQQNATAEKEEQNQIETEEEIMEIMFDAWWGKDDVEDNSKTEAVEYESKEQSTEEDTLKTAQYEQPQGLPLQDKVISLDPPAAGS